MSKPARVAVVIPSWNGRQHLEVSLDALERQDEPGVPWEVWVFDNASQDGTAEWLSQHHPRVRHMASAVNVGFAEAVNNAAQATEAEAVALLNNDTRPQPGWLAALVDALSGASEDVAAVSGMIVDWEGQNLDFGRGVMTFDGHAFQQDFGRPLQRARLPAAGDELPFACGGNMMIWRREFLAAGGFDRDFFAYYEDVDLGWRLWSAGRRIQFVPQATVHHRSSATSDLLGLYNRGMLFERNAFLTAYKNYDDGHWRSWAPAILTTLLARTETLLAAHNPGGETFRIDPYAGHIADTARRVPEAAVAETWWRKVRRYGVREAARRAVAKFGRQLAGLDRGIGPVIRDQRTVAQLRAVSYILRHLEEGTAKRRQTQARRRRPDREIFERFPPYVVPTYPGDENLFADPGFRSMLPGDVAWVESRLGEIMKV